MNIIWPIKKEGSTIYPRGCLSPIAKAESTGQLIAVWKPSFTSLSSVAAKSIMSQHFSCSEQGQPWYRWQIKMHVYQGAWGKLNMHIYICLYVYIYICRYMHIDYQCHCSNIDVHRIHESFGVFEHVTCTSACMHWQHVEWKSKTTICRY